MIKFWSVLFLISNSQSQLQWVAFDSIRLAVIEFLETSLEGITTRVFLISSLPPSYHLNVCNADLQALPRAWPFRDPLLACILAPIFLTSHALDYRLRGWLSIWTIDHRFETETLIVPSVPAVEFVDPSLKSYQRSSKSPHSLGSIV